MKEPRRIRLRQILLLIWLLVIWGHSMMPRPLSAQESGSILDFLIRYLPFLTEHMLRKMAHICEFGLLGMLVRWNRYDRYDKSRCEKKWVESLILCWGAAFIDETIQVFSGRGALVTDIWIDLAGAVLGIVVVQVIGKISGRK